MTALLLPALAFLAGLALLLAAATSAFRADEGQWMERREGGHDR